jgi:hypothetical protein
MDLFGLGRTAALALNVPTAQVLSPWADDSFLERVVIPDLWPDTVPRPMTRGEAMQVPAVSRARHLICATVAKLPLVVLTGATPAPVQPYWCYGTDGQLGTLADPFGDVADDELTDRQLEQRERLAVLRTRYGLVTGQSPFQRMLDTADDLLFCGLSLWGVTSRYADDNRPRTTAHIPYGLWDIDQHGQIIDQDGHPFAADTVILIEGPHEGVLTFGATTIRAASTLEQSAAETARTPFRIGVHQTSEVTLTDDERRAVVNDVRRALAENNGILFTNSALELTEYRLDSAELLVGGRQAAALDVARHLNIPGAMIDAEPTGSTLTYSNPESRNQQWLDYGLSAYTDAIAAALSMDPVVPAGQRTAFDTSTLTTSIAPSTGAPTAD